MSRSSLARLACALACLAGCSSVGVDRAALTPVPDPGDGNVALIATLEADGLHTLGAGALISAHVVLTSGEVASAAAIADLRVVFTDDLVAAHRVAHVHPMPGVAAGGSAPAAVLILAEPEPTAPLRVTAALGFAELGATLRLIGFGDATAAARCSSSTALADYGDDLLLLADRTPPRSGERGAPVLLEDMNGDRVVGLWAGAGVALRLDTHRAFLEAEIAAADPGAQLPPPLPTWNLPDLATLPPVQETPWLDAGVRPTVDVTGPAPAGCSAASPGAAPRTGAGLAGLGLLLVACVARDAKRARRRSK